MDKDKLPGDPSLVSSQDEIEKLIQAAESSQHTYSVEDFFKNPERSGYQLSPNGIYLGFMAPYQRRQNVFVQKIGEDTTLQLTFETARDISGYGWANDRRLIYIKDAGGDENFQLYAVDIDGKNPTDLTPFPGVRIQLIDILEDQEDEIIIGMNKNNPQLFEPYRLNVVTAQLEQLAENSNIMEPISSWMTDHDGRLRLATKVVNGTETILLYRDDESEDFREVLKTDFTESVAPLFFDFKEDHLAYVASNLNRDRLELFRFDMRQAKEIGKPIFKHDDVDVSGLHYSRKRKVLTTVSYITSRQQRHFLDQMTQSWFEKLQKQLPEYEIGVVSHNKDEDKFIIRTHTDRSLGAYYYYDIQTDDLQELHVISPWLKEDQMAEMKAITYKSRDGLTIHGYLSLPVGTEKNMPIVVNPHGGPWVRDVWRYNPEVQLLTSRGYGVFQMNYRGSTGYGKAFWKASFRQWGRKMQDDITDGVHWLIDQGIADRQRVAIYGGSYGGYATLAGLTFTPDLYCCGIDYVGVSNLFTFMKTVPPYWKPYLEMMYKMVGDPEKDEDQMRAASPVFHTDQIKAPLFVIQGANDPRVNIDESDQIVRSLRSKGIEVPYMVKYDEGHGFHNEENRFEVYKAALGFLKRHL